jgi:hypothetical protein
MKSKPAPEFLDNVDQAMELVEKMKKNLPLFVYPNRVFWSGSCANEASE